MIKPKWCYENEIELSEQQIQQVKQSLLLHSGFWLIYRHSLPFRTIYCKNAWISVLSATIATPQSFDIKPVKFEFILVSWLGFLWSTHLTMDFIQPLQTVNKEYVSCVRQWVIFIFLTLFSPTQRITGFSFLMNWQFLVKRVMHIEWERMGLPSFMANFPHSTLSKNNA